MQKRSIKAVIAKPNATLYFYMLAYIVKQFHAEKLYVIQNMQLLKSNTVLLSPPILTIHRSKP